MLNSRKNISNYKNNCMQDIVDTEYMLRDFKRRYVEINQESGFYRIFKASKYREKKKAIEKRIAELEEKLKELKLELEIYNTFGLDIPQNISNYHQIMAMIERRDKKLEILILIEMGQM